MANKAKKKVNHSHSITTNIAATKNTAFPKEITMLMLDHSIKKQGGHRTAGPNRSHVALTAWYLWH